MSDRALRRSSRQMALLLVLVSGVGAFAAGQANREKDADARLPDEARARLEKSGMLARYDVANNLKPFYLHGDFDGDGKADYAVLVANKETKKRGIAVVRSAATGVEMLGAGGTRLRVGSGADSYLLDDFDWMDEWRIEGKREASAELGRGMAARMRGEGIVVGKSESASALVFWDGKRWLWKQMGD